MQSYYRQHADSIAHFKTEARKAFAEICETYGLQERTSRLRNYENHFQIVFSNRRLKIRAEGINWGMNAAVFLRTNRKNGVWFSISHLLQERVPDAPVIGSQTEQLYGYAQYLQIKAADILAGGCSFFDKLEAKFQKEKEEAEKTKQTEIVKKLAEGYTQIENAYGEPILRKPRPKWPVYEAAREQFSEATEVILTDVLETQPGGALQLHTAIITKWYADVGETVQQHENLCTLTTDKVELDIPSPVSGKLVWLLPEGTMVEEKYVIAIIL